MKKHYLAKAMLKATLSAAPWLLPCCGGESLKAQDNLWVNGSQLLDFNDPLGGLQSCGLPFGPDPMDYHGAQAQYAQNAEYDENGKLLFFTVDGNLYDHEGYLMADNLLATNCIDCLMLGLQEISFVLVPGTCDKYYIIAADSRFIPAGGVDASQIGYGILDLAGPSRHHIGRMGRVFHYDDDPAYTNLFLAAMGTVPGSNEADDFLNLLFAQKDASYLPDNLSVGGEATFVIGSGNIGVQAPSSSRRNNIYHVVYNGATPEAPKTLLVHTAMEYLQAPITQRGIPNLTHLSSGGQSSFSDEPLTMTGGLAIAQGPDNVVRMATTYNVSMSVTPGPNIHTLEIGQVFFAGGTATNLSNVGVNTYNGSTPTTNGGRMRGLAFSPNGRYLYFSQAFTPRIGYVDVMDPGMVVHDLEADLNLSPGTLANYANGQIRMNRAPDGNGYAIYFPSASSLGYLTGPDSPTNASWHSAMPAAVILNAPPASALAQQITPPVTQYLMDGQNYRDPQIAALQRQVCCQSNERIPEGNHPNSFGGTTTFSNPWTPQANPFTSPALCAPANGSNAAAYLYFAQTFTVLPGARLYVSNMEWRFAPDAKLIIAPGAFVQFNNCVLRGDVCGPAKWPGVELRGTPYMAQGYSLYPPDQGHMIFIGSTLQDAIVGVTMGTKNPFGMVQQAGGILETSNSTFRNCRVGVNFYPYQNHLPNGNPTRNRSNFVNTTFVADANFIAPYDFAIHAQLWRVDGIPFTACVFKNQRTTEQNSSQLGQGIRSLDANYTVKAGCTAPPPLGGTCLNPIPCRFEGLDHGIHAYTANSMFTFIADQAEFTDNVCGVYVNGTPAFQVQRSTFKVGGSHATVLNNTEELFWYAANRGTYSYQSQGFLLKYNTALRSANATPLVKPEGFVTGWTGASDDLVRWNTSQNLRVGFVGEGICSNADQVHGLAYRCNTTDGNGTGIYSRTVPSFSWQTPLQIIRYLQGTSGGPAGNKFIGNAVDLRNDNQSRSFEYWWWQPQPSPFYPYTIAGQIIRLWSEKDTLCADHFPVQTIVPGDPEPPPTEPLAYRAALMHVAQARKLEYANTRYLYDQLIDGGNTDETVQEIQESWPNEAWSLRAKLLQKSPYLSSDVLMEVVKKNIMPAAMVAEIYIANPEATRKGGLVRWLEYEAPIAMPQYLLENIEASWDQKTYRSTLEKNMAFSRSEMSQAIYHVLGSFNADTTGTPVDSIRATLQVLRTPDARYMEILTYLQQDNFDSAFAVMDRLPVEFKLREKEISEKDRTKQYIGLVQTYRNAGRSEAELNESDLNALRNLAANAYDRPAEWAQNILCFGYGECRAPLSGGEGGQPLAMRQPLAQAEAPPAPVLMLQPNPADAWVAMNYHLDATADKACLVVRDATGREVETIPMERSEGQTVYDTRRLAPGTYTVELVNAGRHIEAQKLVVRP